MRFPPEFIERVQEASNLVEIISQYTQLRPSGQGYMGRCPFPDHKEKTPSFSVSESKQVYNCFGCKKTGNLFIFLKDYNGMSFPEAVEYLADRAGIPLPVASNDHDDVQQKIHDKKKQILKLNKSAAEFFTQTFQKSPAEHNIRSYAKKRNLTPEIIQEFQIGFAPSEWDSLVQHFNRLKISLPLAEEAKLIKARKENNGFFDLFRDRLMFPIISPTGEVLAFGGRIHDQGEPKYLNSPETQVFHKGRVLYGLAQTGKYIRTQDEVIIVEGYMDLVSLYQAGIKNLAATMGTALTADHARLIKRITQNVVVLFDGDLAGQVAAERSLPILLSSGLYARGVFLTDAKDPDEFVNRFGVEALQAKIAKAPDLFNLVLQMWMKDYKGEASQKVKLVDTAIPIFQAITDNRLKSLYATELAQRMNVSMEWVRSALLGKSGASGASPQSGAGRNQAGPQQTSPSGPSKANESLPGQGAQPKQDLKIKISGATQAETLLMQLGLKSRANFEMVESQQILSQINHLGIKTLLEKAQLVYRQDVNKFDRLTSLLIDEVDVPSLLFQTNAGVESEFDAEKETKMLSDCVRRIQQDSLKSQAKSLAMGMKQNVDTEKLKEIESIQRNRISLGKNEK